MITIRRIYEPEPGTHEYKVLIDRLWPRGISKDKATWNEWQREIAPTDELRKWYNHDPLKWEEFKQRYKNELSGKDNELKRLKQLESAHGTLTFLTSSKETEHNHAVALKQFLIEIG